MKEKTKYVVPKVPAQEAQGISNRNHGENREDSENNKMSLGLAQRGLMMLINSVEFFTSCGDCPTCSPVPTQHLEKLRQKV
jgi:hypothetical protein